MKNIFLSLALVLGMAVAISTPKLIAQQTDPASQAQAQQPGEMPAQSQDMSDFTGTIAKEHGKLVLKDASTGSSYQIADQAKAKQFVGKAVKVTGKLDTTTNVLHIQSIEISGS